MSKSIKSSDLSKVVAKQLDEYGELADSAMKNAVRKTATQVKKEIPENAPKRTGRYAKSWVAEKTYESDHALEMTVRSKDCYPLAHLLEDGHDLKSHGVKIGHVEGKPHIAPAEQHGEELLETLLKKELS